MGAAEAVEPKGGLLPVVVPECVALGGVNAMQKLQGERRAGEEAGEAGEPRKSEERRKQEGKGAPSSSHPTRKRARTPPTHTNRPKNRQEAWPASQQGTRRPTASGKVLKHMRTVLARPGEHNAPTPRPVPMSGHPPNQRTEGERREKAERRRTHTQPSPTRAHYEPPAAPLRPPPPPPPPLPPAPLPPAPLPPTPLAATPLRARR